MIVSGVKNNPLVNLQEQFSLSMTPFCLNQVQNVLYIYITLFCGLLSINSQKVPSLCSICLTLFQSQVPPLKFEYCLGNFLFLKEIVSSLSNLQTLKYF